MHKRIDTVELDIPQDDIECWDRYPKYKWVYDVSRVLDAQNIKWAPFETNILTDKIANMTLHTVDGIQYEKSHVFVGKLTGDCYITDVYIVKGEIKLLRCANADTQSISPDLPGDVELRINAFVSIYFQKFTGVLSTHTVGNNIYAIHLLSTLNTDGIEETKLIKKIYKANTVIQVSSPYMQDTTSLA